LVITMNVRSSRLTLASVAASTFLASSALAQAPRSASPPPAAAAPAATGDIAEARKHYEAGVQLFDTGAYEAALSEFERADQLAPNYRILYNTGKIYRVRNDFVAALNAFNGFLAKEPEGSQKRIEVLRYVSELNALIAKVRVTSAVPGASITVDDVPQGVAPLDHALLVNPGSRKVTASKPGYSPATQVVKAVPGDVLDITLNPQSLLVKVQSDPLPLSIPISWATTGVLAGGAIIFGALASSKASTLNSAKNQLDSTGTLGSQLTSDYNSMKTFAIVSDIFTGAAIVAGGVSTYFTVKFLTRGKKDSPTPVTVTFLPTGGSVGGSF
jgi:hypothetical protein